MTTGTGDGHGGGAESAGTCYPIKASTLFFDNTGDVLLANETTQPSGL
ncbi:hypothetical protein ACIBI8_01000 [Streptomyces sp. NPDC050529]